jgi:adenine-specific DNA-methyltransferase
MATGVPKTRGRAESSRNRRHNHVEITYLGKKSREEVLQHPATCLVPVWANEKRAPNRFYFGDNAEILAALAEDPDICGKVRLVYIDPPFATQSSFHSRELNHAYDDVVDGAEFIESLRERLILLHRLLAEDGSLYLHLDDKMVFQMKLILDEIFGATGYRNCITRKKCNPKNYTRRQYGNVSDFILFYTKSDDYVWNRPYECWTEERAKEYHYIEKGTGRRFMKVPVHAPGIRNGETGREWRGVLPPPGKHWQFPPRVLDEMDARGEIYWSPSGNPRRKVYLDASPGVGVQDIWMDFRDAHNQNICITGYPTEKNPDLLRRIIEASSNRGDLVLDCYAGSGTTLAVAEQMGRRWIGVDNSVEALKTTLERFALGTTPMGDFVSERVKERQSHTDLFAGLDEQTNVSVAAPRQRQPVPSFSVWAEKTGAKQTAAHVEGWARTHRVRDGRTLQG